MVLEYLKENSEKAFFSKEIADILKQPGVKISDILTIQRRGRQSLDFHSWLILATEDLRA